ncbi:uncharacterized protein N0V89_007336 [Didymosphaeria variabile]|uniref:S-adenosyl-L-methionine-dependent methyltransferase n=1 Tax=Didymosphaeria variabile TaxID=1932322 RepID=A0A9W8XIN0_9PLEO|nr:uncharacterized protein N0V89_007336 [Didymosphaeria variabile]KAJ4351990.1 hypothetical protein N0V89_007336 [Didymosphaeria variabile]
MAATQEQPHGLDDSSKITPTRPVVARMYDWYLGGTHSYEIDRQAAAEVAQKFPDIIPTAVENRMFLRRAVSWLAQNDVTQFIDLGSGLPTTGSTHETVLAVNNKARVLYVDIEESAVQQGKKTISEGGWELQVGMIRASALEPDAIVAHPETQRIIDFNEPVAIMMFALIHFWTPTQYNPVLHFWKSNVVKGSAFVMTHGTEDGRNEEERKQLDELAHVYKRTPTPVIWRTKEDVKLVMEGWELVEPGLVRPHLWKAEEVMKDGEKWPLTKMWWAAVGFLE